MDGCQIISSAELRHLKQRALFWYTGWIAAIILSYLTALGWSEALIIHKTIEEVRHLQEQTLDIQDEQKHITSSFERAWLNLQATTETVLEQKSYIQERRGFPKASKQKN